jgi:hypothetical protein
VLKDDATINYTAGVIDRGHQVYLRSLCGMIRIGVLDGVELSDIVRVFTAGMVPLPSKRRGCIADA